jgi:hypothetical protein
VVMWKPVIIGFLLAIILGILFSIVGGSWGEYIGVLVAGIIVGYMVNRDIMNGIIHGALIGVIGGIVLAILIIILAAAIGGTLGALILLGGGLGIILLIILWAIFAGIGGAIGAMIKGRGSEEMKAETGEKMTGEEPMVRKSPNIEFNQENIAKCLCPGCPVQADSECAKEKLMKLQEIMQSEEKTMPTPEDVPGVYCATGKAICTDIDPSKECQCPNCPMWKEYDLENGKPAGVFCRDGKAM